MKANRKNRTLADDIFDEVVSRIVTGAYKADFQLPGEHELSESFSVSRPVLRDALKRLRDEGYIYSRHGIGSFVRRRSNGANALGYTPVDSIADIQRCYEFRLILEPQAAYLAATRRNDEVLKSLEEVLESLNTATRLQTHREDADFEFHYGVATAANNHYFTSTIGALKEHVSVGMKLHGKALLGPESGLQGVYDEHCQIYEAIRTGDADGAETAMRGHLAGSRDRLFEGRLLDLSLT